MCGKRFTFLYTSPYEHVQKRFRLSTFVFSKCSEKNSHDYICGKELKGVWWE